MKKIVCTHLYNDFSGSPLVLSTVIKGFLSKGVEVDLVTASRKAGFLSDLPIRYVDNQYKFAENKWIRLVYFFYTQVLSFFKMWQYRNQDVIVYVNTLLPFGVAIAGKLMKKQVVFHIHETSVKPAILKGFLKWVCRKTASEIIYVSDFLRQQEPIGTVSSTVVHNALSHEFIQKAKKYQKGKEGQKTFTVLMLCSLKKYKGTDVFVQLASALPNLNFQLVLNADEAALNDYFQNETLPNNLQLFPKQSNVHPFYQQADLVLNLSHPEQWVETFGMTLLEAMEYGIPVIAPKVGGCVEFVEHDINGYKIDQRDSALLIQKINQLSTDKGLYLELTKNAKNKAAEFSVANLWQGIFNVVWRGNDYNARADSAIETKSELEEIS